MGEMTFCGSCGSLGRGDVQADYRGIQRAEEVERTPLEEAIFGVVRKIANEEQKLNMRKAGLASVKKVATGLLVPAVGIWALSFAVGRPDLGVLGACAVMAVPTGIMAVKKGLVEKSKRQILRLEDDIVNLEINNLEM